MWLKILEVLTNSLRVKCGFSSTKDVILGISLCLHLIALLFSGLPSEAEVGIRAGWRGAKGRE